MKSKEYIDLAYKASLLSSYDRVHIGAVIVKNGRVVSMGTNKMKTHPLQKKYSKFRPFCESKCYLHAEVSAIVNSSCDISGGIMYIARKNKKGEWALCRPCPSCMKAIADFGIKKIYYTDEQNKIIEERIGEKT